MNIAIVDDQKIEIKLLTKYITNYMEQNDLSVPHITTFNNSIDMLNNFHKGDYTLIFLDIYMDEMNGIDLARNIRALDNEVKIIFCTSSNEFATESYEVKASFYLLKPYNTDSFAAMMNLVLPKNEKGLKTITLPEGNLVIPKNILYTDYFNHKITIYCKFGDNITTRMSMLEFEELFKDLDYIVPCNRGIIVNLNEVKKIEGETLFLSNQKSLPISRSKLASVREAYRTCCVKNIQDKI